MKDIDGQSPDPAVKVFASEDLLDELSDRLAMIARDGRGRSYIARVIESVHVEGGAFNVREGNHALNLGTVYALTQLRQNED